MFAEWVARRSGVLPIVSIALAATTACGDITLVSAETGAAGTTAEVEVVGPEKAMPPNGNATGNPGANGPAGENGAAGVNGEAGVNGAAGTKGGGSPGAAGTSGVAGTGGATCAPTVGCCVADADCRAGEECVGGACDAEGRVSGACKKVPKGEDCWSDADCGLLAPFCEGPRVCPCGAVCKDEDKPGKCRLLGGNEGPG